MDKQRPPTIFLTFAQDHKNAHRFLKNLGREKERLRRTFTDKKEHIQAKFAVSEDPADWVAELQDCRKEITLFHFSGHANSQLLQFMQNDGSPAHISGRRIAPLFEKELAPHLDLVFLNACATSGHVKYFHEVGVPIVIATPKSVLDTDAFKFSDIFYRSLMEGNTLKQAFNDALVPVSYSVTGGGIHPYRGFELDEEEVGEEKWGLFLLEENLEKWRLFSQPDLDRPRKVSALLTQPDWKQLQKYITRNQFRKVFKVLEKSIGEEDQIALNTLQGQLGQIETNYIHGIHSTSEDMAAKNKFRFALLQFVKKLEEEWE